MHTPRASATDPVALANEGRVTALRAGIQAHDGEALSLQIGQMMDEEFKLDLSFHVPDTSPTRARHATERLPADGEQAR